LTLIKDGVSDELWKNLLLFQKENLFRNFYLVGGTALSLQIGHRTSFDIDLFTPDELNKSEILEFAKSINDDVEIKSDSRAVFQLFLNFHDPEKILKIDFVQYQYPLLDPYVQNEENLRIIGKNDLSAMKMSATGTRGNEARDFIDLYYLLKEITMEKIVDNFKKKYKEDNIAHYLRSMNYFNDVNTESWQSVKLLRDKLTANEVKIKLDTEVNKYWENTMRLRKTSG